MRTKLTEPKVARLKPGEKDTDYWDTLLPGFHVRVKVNGRKVFYLHYRTRQGRRRKPMIGAHGVFTCDQARTVARAWLREVAIGKDPYGEIKGEDVLTVSELAKKYMAEYARVNKKKSSADEDERNFENHIKPRLGEMRVDSVTRSDVMRLHSSMSDRPIAANRVRALLSKMFDLAEDWGYRERNTNPARGKGLNKEVKRKRYLSAEELKRLTTALQETDKARLASPYFTALVKLLIFTGARVGEILSLQWSMVDTDAGVIRLSESKTGAKLLYLNAGAVEVLKGLYGMKGRASSAWVIRGRLQGEPMVNAQKPWRALRKKAELPELRMHDLRHTFASVGAGLNLGLPTIGKLLGHQRSETTARYSHLAQDPVRDANDKIGAALAEMMRQGGAKVVDVVKENPEAEAEHG